jgi:hypothetical protein
MAKQVEAPPSDQKEVSRIPDEWFNGAWWEIEPGKDVATDDPEKARRILYQIGRYRKKTPRTRVQNGKVYIQARR